MGPNPRQVLPQDPRQVPPAVVAYLLNGAKVSEAVFMRALLTLAEEGWLRIEPEDSGVPVVRINRLPGPGQVRPYEQLALERVVQRMGTLTNVPLSALTSNEGDDYAPWWKRFRDAITAQAREAGLVGRSVRAGMACGVPFGVAIAAGIATGVEAGSIGGGFGAAFGALMVCALIIARVDRPRLTDQGKLAAEWWRQNGGGFDGTVITDQLPAGASPSPFSPESLAEHGSAPLPDGYVWSSYGGHWRTVKVGSLKAPQWGRPATAVWLGVFGAFFTLPATVIGRLLVGGGTGTLISAAPLTLACALILGVWLPANQRRAAIPKHATFTGQVVKRWTYESGGEDSTTYYCCCIDDGTSSDGWSFHIERGLYYQMRVGDFVSVSFNPRWKKLKQIELNAPAPGPRA